MTTASAQQFALTDMEMTFGTDDTFWQFLRNCPEYQRAFRRVSKMPNNTDALTAILEHIQNPSFVRIASSQDDTCRQKFGIGAWLDYTHEQLPRLKHSDDSWFFHLKRPVQEDPRRKEVSAEPPLLDGRLPPFETPRLLAEELAFGYGNLESLPTRQGRFCYPERMLCVAIDCSVPPDGQLSALKTLARTLTSQIAANRVSAGFRLFFWTIV